MKPFRVVALWLAVLAVSGSAGEAQLDKFKNVFGKAKQVAGFSISEEEEIALGEAISAKIRARYGVAQDPEVTRYVSLVGMVVVSGSERPDLPWTWVILDSDAVNAFAAPGGFVHVTRGALAVIGSEAELAGVLAHEAAHVTEKHTIKGLEKSKTLDFAREQAPGGGGRTKFLVDALADKATEAILAGFGRKEELEADEVGIGLAARAGYAPAGLVEFLATLAARSGGGGGGGLFRSHPETEERIERAEKQIAADRLAGGARVEERYAASVPYEVAATSTGGPAVEGARGVAGATGGAADSKGDQGDEAADGEGEEGQAEEGQAEEGQKKGRFKLAKLRNPFGKESEQKSAEVTGAGAGRAVGEEGEETGGGPKNPALVEVSITRSDLAAFRREGGLPG